MSLSKQFLQSWENEFPITLRLLKAFPSDQAEFKPHERSQSAKDLAVQFYVAPQTMNQIVDGTFTFPPQGLNIPERWEDLVRGFQSAHSELVKRLREATDSQVQTTLKIPTSRSQSQDVPAIDFMWFILSDHIHHRGQFSVYIRLAGGKVPSIYGASADEQDFDMDFSKFRRG
jgi:uncharacterized damage-inducible protein DinB